jgi:hypothetical protein
MAVPSRWRKTNLGFMKLRATGPVDLEYRGTAEQKAFAA